MSDSAFRSQRLSTNVSCLPFTHNNQDGLEARLGPGPPPTKIRAAPFVQIPLGVTEDRLVGTVDIEASMKVGVRLVTGELGSYMIGF